MTESNKLSALKIQELSFKIEAILSKNTDNEGKLDIIKLSESNVNLSEVVGLFLLTNSWENSIKELSRQIARLIVVLDKSNDLSKAISKIKHSLDN